MTLFAESTLLSPKGLSAVASRRRELPVPDKGSVGRVYEVAYSAVPFVIRKFDILEYLRGYDRSK